MNGRFIFRDVDLRDKSALREILKQIPIVAEPEFMYPLSEVFLDNSPSGLPLTRRQAYNRLAFTVTTSNEYDEKGNDFKIRPVKTQKCEGVSNYDFRKLHGTTYRIIEAWNDGQTIIQVRRGKKSYELGFFT